MKACEIPELLRSAIKDGKPLPTARTARLMLTAADTIERLRAQVDKLADIYRSRLYRDVDMQISVDSAYRNIFAALADLRGVAKEEECHQISAPNF